MISMHMICIARVVIKKYTEMILEQDWELIKIVNGESNHGPWNAGVRDTRTWNKPEKECKKQAQKIKSSR